MAKLRLVVILVTVATAVVAVVRPGLAQTSEKPLVVFIEGQPLDSAAMTNVGPDGISQLADLFRGLGAQVEFSNLTTPIPTDARVVVLLRPLRSLSLPQVAYLWAHIKRGNNLLLGIDPENYYSDRMTVRPRYTRSGLSPLFDSDFGVALQDSILAEPWYSTESIASLETTYALTYPGTRDPITQPLIEYGLPVWVWGARSMHVDPIGVGSTAGSLLVTNTAYAETDATVFGTRTAAATGQVGLNIGQDETGRLVAGARVLDTMSGARIVVLGDSEMLENGYGLVPGMQVPRYPSNLVFAQRVASWLLDLPPEDWPAMPRGFTWLAVDGSGSDWEGRNVNSWSDLAADASSANLDVVSVSGFADDKYVYFLVGTRAAPPAQARLLVQFDGAPGGNVGSTLAITTSSSTLTRTNGTQADVPDATMVVGDSIEVRWPRRAGPSSLRIDQVCVDAGETTSAVSSDCVVGPLRVTIVNTAAPFDFMLNDQLLATVYTSGAIYMRSGPETTYGIVATLANGTTLAAIGRNSDASWIKVQNARYTGWVAAFLLTPNGDFTHLPVVDAPPT